MFRIHIQNMVREFFQSRLGIHDSDDLRGALYARDSRRYQPITMDSVDVGIAFNNFVGRTCCIHFVIQDRTGFTRQILRESFEYVFNTCRCNTAIALVDSVNKESIDRTKRIGFVEQMVIPDGGLQGDLIVFTMNRGQCRWLGKEH